MRSETFKLVDGHGDVLGVIWVPTKWAQTIGSGGSIEATWYDPGPIATYGQLADKPAAAGTVTLFCITPSRLKEGTVRMDGIPLSEFEKLPGCAFAPGYAESKRGPF